jgi:hypothetical protein
VRPSNARGQKPTDLASQRPNGTATEQSFKHTPDAPGIATLKARLSLSKMFQKIFKKI